VLDNTPLYLLNVIKFPKWALGLINSQMAHCLCDNYEGHYKYHLANWGLVSQKKDYGGLGELHMCLLSSWVRRYQLNNNKIWKQIIDYKYKVEDPSIFCCPTVGASPFWKDVMWAAKAAKFGYQ
jgi:hypothetical protein